MVIRISMPRLIPATYICSNLQRPGHMGSPDTPITCHGDSQLLARYNISQISDITPACARKHIFQKRLTAIPGCRFVAGAYLIIYVTSHRIRKHTSVHIRGAPLQLQPAWLRAGKIVQFHAPHLIRVCERMLHSYLFSCIFAEIGQSIGSTGP